MERQLNSLEMEFAKILREIEGIYQTLKGRSAPAVFHRSRGPVVHGAPGPLNIHRLSGQRSSGHQDL